MKDSSIIKPKEFINYLKEKDGIKGLDKVPKNCILVSSHGDPFDSIKDKTEKVSWDFGSRHIYLIRENVGMVYFGVGLGGTFGGILLEELIALGVENFILIGGTGGLQDSLEIGDIVIPDKAVRDEGVSKHYQKSGKFTYPSGYLVDRLENTLQRKGVTYHKGGLWTIDIPYRETKNKVKRFKSEGILSVDASAASLFSIANYRRKNIAALFQVSDSLASLEWNPQFHSDHTEDKKSLMMELATETLEKI